MNSIQPLQTPLSLPGMTPSAIDAPAGGKSFTEHLMDSIREVNNMQQSADQAVTQMVTGGDVNPAEVLTAVQKADIAFRMMMQIRNKLLDAYNEIKDVKV